MLFSFHVAWFDYIYLMELKKHPCMTVWIPMQTFCRLIYLFVSVSDSISRCFDAVLLYSIAGDHLLRQELIGATGMSRFVFLLLCLHQHILMAKLSDWLLINSCAQVSSAEKTEGDRERHQHIIHSIYLYPQRVCPFLYSHCKHCVVDGTSDKMRCRLILSAFTHHPGSFVSLCTDAREHTMRAT